MTVRIAVVGLGLIGGSLARRLADSYDVVSYDAAPATRDLAGSSGLAVAADLPTAVHGASVVFLAVALPALPLVLGQVAAELPDSAVLSDVGSVKSPLYAAVRTQGLGGRFVGGHPMAGTERSGFAASDPELYDGAAWVLCLEPDTDLQSWLRLAGVLTGIGARVVPATAADHDAAVARVSHLSHLLAAALASTAAEAGPLAMTLAAGSFRDGTRVAATAPSLPTSMCRSNRAALVAALSEAMQRLHAAQADPGPLLAAGHRARLAWEHRPTVPAELPIAAEGLPDRLLDLGRHGGWVDGIGPDLLSVRLPQQL